nr:PilZ domain-containing protein [Pseudomonadota bacterium]
PEGCRVELVERVRPGDRLWLSLPGIESLEAAVCWVDNFVAGVEFVRPLHPSVFEMLTQRMRG